ncbi:hypothetical protein MNB_SV-13-2044 [hydrothermal vent metagenome]|uniref:Paraquat-inducible protein A n=1 Tax=hydrothermal vent metagenome TaxID=652676 RepID=A0A1W1CYR0_9ZZZZ
MLGYIKKLLAISSGILLIVMFYLSLQLVESGKTARYYKTDYAELHSVAYGMFNSDIWTRKVTKIIDDKIENFDFNENNRVEIKSYISKIIDTLILEADRVVREHNQGKRGFFDSIMGSTKQMITDSILDIRKLRDRVPEFTNAVMEEVEKPENQQRAKLVLREKLKQFTEKRFTPSTDMTDFNAILTKYNTKTLEECTLVLENHRTLLSESMNEEMEKILLLALIIIILIVLHGVLSSLTLFVLASSSLILLVSGVMLPMLDIEAKISKLYFVILDKSVVFENQILFFQSKSISDLVRVLLDSGEAKMILVGLLLVMFSIIFPSIKLLASYLYFYSKGFLGNNPITYFFALRSTKWSMADVMVVSIFMAYLGLDGVISNELKHLEKNSAPVNIITSNETHLEVGFFLFLGFVATSFVLSLMVEYKRKKDLLSK